MHKKEGTRVRSSGNYRIYTDPTTQHVGILSPNDDRALDYHAPNTDKKPVREIVLLKGPEEVIAAQIGPAAVSALLAGEGGNVTVTRGDDKNGYRSLIFNPPLREEKAAKVIKKQREDVLGIYGLEGLLPEEGATAGVVVLEIPKLQAESEQAKREMALAELEERGVTTGLILQIGLTAVVEPENYKEAASVLHQLGMLPLPKKEAEKPTDTINAPNTTTARLPLDVNSKLIQLTRSDVGGSLTKVINEALERGIAIVTSNDPPEEETAEIEHTPEDIHQLSA